MRHPTIETMTGHHRTLILASLLFHLCVLVPSLAWAQAPQFLGSFKDWNVYAFDEDGQKICYMASEPKKQDGNYERRGSPAVLVTRRPGPEVADEVSVQPGYNYLDGSDVEVQVDSRQFLLFTRGEHAWTKSKDEDQNLIGAMKRGRDMTVKGTSTRSTFSLDTYSLLGFTKAYSAMLQACAN